ncbi:MAG: DNA mismatch endonuclease Vsr [Polyangiaceae bacterium]|nr:DNA mismatch endonuclease Vsr [Polyangiaceae bacterium]
MKTKWPTDARTSARMKRVGKSATAAELRVRATLRLLGVRSRTVVRSLPGTPDLGSKKRRWVIFVNGCFWHGHPGCSRATIPRRNRAAWLAKIAANKSRDTRVERELRGAGFSVLVVWECQTLDAELLGRRLRSFFRRIDTQPRRSTSR